MSSFGVQAEGILQLERDQVSWYLVLVVSQVVVQLASYTSLRTHSTPNMPGVSSGVAGT